MFSAKRLGVIHRNLGYCHTQETCFRNIVKNYLLAARYSRMLGETLIKPCNLQMIELVCAKQNWKETEHFYLLNGAILDLSYARTERF
jgi:hypothetical protein